MLYKDDFTYYYFNSNGNLLEAPSCSAVPEEVEDFCSIHEAISYVQGLGCLGRSQHQIRNAYHRLCLAVLRLAVEKYGEVFPTLLRGTRSQRPDAEYKILFGTLNPQVAEFYGSIKEYKNIKGLRSVAQAIKSVVSDDYSQIDEEIIFFPTN